MRNLGIDATNLLGGGGRTHLIELLRAADPPAHGIDRVIVWASRSTLDLLDDNVWLLKRNPPELNGGLLQRSLWQLFQLSIEAKVEECDVLFVPGGSYAGHFHPFVVMSQNMLPFEWAELRRFGLSLSFFRHLILRFFQSRSFRRADGVVFLTEYARDAVQEVTGKLQGLVDVIPHGLTTRFCLQPRPQLAISSYSAELPLRILYVSIVNQYKHQWAVIEALGRLRERTHWPLTLDLVGLSYPPALQRLNRALDRWDPERRWVRYHGAVNYDLMHSFYQKADIGVFASSCENLPIILLETMAAGIPVASSDCGPMPEVLGNAGVYFNPLLPMSIEVALERLISSPHLRFEMAQASYARALAFSWRCCADKTFDFLASNMSLSQVE